MPYIRDERRRKVCPFTSKSADSAGELNYQLTMLCQEYLFNKGECYQTYNDIIGALEGCKMEMYRRKVAPYEDTKIKENSDVW